MSYYSETIENEIHLAKDECCIIFDFSCYFPYSNKEDLLFDFSLGMETFSDYKLNHRYPNKNHHTISKKYGRKVSKMGYPYIMKLSEQSSFPIILTLDIGLKNQYLTLIFPLQTYMTAKKPICSLSLNYHYDNGEFYFTSHEVNPDGIGRLHHVWSNHRLKYEDFNTKILDNPKLIEGSYTLVYENIIEPCASTLLDLRLW